MTPSSDFWRALMGCPSTPCGSGGRGAMPRSTSAPATASSPSPPCCCNGRRAPCACASWRTATVPRPSAGWLNGATLPAAPWPTCTASSSRRPGRRSRPRSGRPAPGTPPNPVQSQLPLQPPRRRRQAPAYWPSPAQSRLRLQLPRRRRQARLRPGPRHRHRPLCRPRRRQPRGSGRAGPPTPAASAAARCPWTCSAGTSSGRRRPWTCLRGAPRTAPAPRLLHRPTSSAAATIASGSPATPAARSCP
mmetsp:Transcript_90394/g.286431  ORF Transcript_90394/g.286431 Transcript_90394/m.286431 type:complete len:248 (+) Transcript_90394:501-1244(+)